MRRCIDLAGTGAGKVRTNPLVGAVLVHEGRIIGEGYHAYFGGPHAEVNAVQSVPPRDRDLIPASTLYVTLEPCCTSGKTPPCSTLILQNRIPEVVVACTDPSPEMNGQSLDLLRRAGVKVRVGLLESEATHLIDHLRARVLLGRPKVILKWARSQSGYMAPVPPRAFWITDPTARRLVHKWRAEADAILVGYQTALVDNPGLTTRYYHGEDPRRVILDPGAALPAGLQVFEDGKPTLLVTAPGSPDREELPDSVQQIKLPFDRSFPGRLLRHLLSLETGIVLVEGGASTLGLCIEAGAWDEARVLTGPNPLEKGRRAPDLPLPPETTRYLGSNRIEIYRNPKPLDLLNLA